MTAGISRLRALLCLSLAAGCARTVAVPPMTAAECEALEARFTGSQGDATIVSMPTDTVPRELVLRYWITAGGRTEAFRVVRSSGNARFDRAVVLALSCARFTPARAQDDGRAVAAEMEQRFVWRRPPAAAPDSSSGVQGRPRS